MEALDLLDQATQNPVGINQYSQPVDNVNTRTEQPERPDGNAATYALRKLRKDRPDIRTR